MRRRGRKRRYFALGVLITAMLVAVGGLFLGIRAEDAVIRTGELTMDQDTHEVLVGDVPVELSPTEFKLLRYLMLNPNRVLSKAQILDHVWEYDFNGDAGIVESYVSYLRRKLDQHSTEPLIQTKRGFGYMLKSSKP